MQAQPWASLTAHQPCLHQCLTSVAKAFTEQKPGFNWVIYWRTSKLEENLFWSSKCLEKSLSCWLCVEFSSTAHTSVCLLWTPASWCTFIYLVPLKPPFLPLKCFCPFVVYLEIIWPSDISSPTRTSRKLYLCFCILDDGVKSLWEACAPWIMCRL